MDVMESKKRLIEQLMKQLQGDDDMDFHESMKPKGGSIEVSKVKAEPLEGDPMSGDESMKPDGEVDIEVSGDPKDKVEEMMGAPKKDNLMAMEGMGDDADKKMSDEEMQELLEALTEKL